MKFIAKGKEYTWLPPILERVLSKDFLAFSLRMNRLTDARVQITNKDEFVGCEHGLRRYGVGPPVVIEFFIFYLQGLLDDSSFFVISNNCFRHLEAT